MASGPPGPCAEGRGGTQKAQAGLVVGAFQSRLVHLQAEGAHILPPGPCAVISLSLGLNPHSFVCSLGLSPTL